MFKNLCLVVLLLLAGSLVSKFHFQLTKKGQRKVPEKVGQSPNFIKNFTIPYEKNLSTSILHIMFALLIRIYRAVARLQNKTRQDSSAKGRRHEFRGIFLQKSQSWAKIKTTRLPRLASC